MVAGFGFRRGASIATLAAVLEMARQGGAMPAALATLREKANALAPLADRLGLPLIAVDGGALAAARTITQSPSSLRAYGTGSVAEASALVAAGHDARLLGARHISPDRMATCAIAEGASS